MDNLLSKNENNTSSSTTNVIKQSSFICSQCSKSFSSKGNLKNHIITIHQKIRPYKCPYNNCNKAYSTSSRLEIHKRTHIGIKPFKCMICGKRFNEKGNLKTHQIFHSAERPFKCKYCEKTYKTNCHLKEHIEINHLNIKKFKCSICKCSFGRHSTLLIHLRTHGKKNIEDNSVSTNQISNEQNTNEIIVNNSHCDFNFSNVDINNNNIDDFIVHDEESDINISF